ncbi:hypothetical protein HHK36_000199 [Tetracentron sinense]|uniref:KIB1-4 beta-propeller domain-containing protein n=1 Tax=Tetracentron sinense TaxID=13715 RepID=A0A834ZR73_TETSI|nr:hypothetical protein HHK36_000199 [Tetracentron sinense]
MADWSKLQSDLVWLIAKQLELYKDFIAFRGVCSWWRTVANEGIFTFPESPWLMLAEEKDSDTRSFFSLSKKGIVEKRMLPEAKGKRCWGSHGWLITFDIDLNINLLNPWTRLQIHLPHQRTFKGQNYWLTLTDLQKHYIAKAVLSSSPSSSSSSSSSDYVVMVIHGNLFKLGFAKAGDKSWTTIETWFGMYSDILFYKGLFYAVNYNGLVFVCDVEGSNPTEARCVSRKPVGFMDCPSKIYLVESSGALLVVSRRPSKVKSMLDDVKSKLEKERCGYLGHLAVQRSIRPSEQDGDEGFQYGDWLRGTMGSRDIARCLRSKQIRSTTVIIETEMVKFSGEAEPSQKVADDLRSPESELMVSMVVIHGAAVTEADAVFSAENIGTQDMPDHQDISNSQREIDMGPVTNSKHIPLGDMVCGLDLVTSSRNSLIPIVDIDKKHYPRKVGQEKELLCIDGGGKLNKICAIGSDPGGLGEPYQSHNLLTEQAPRSHAPYDYQLANRKAKTNAMGYGKRLSNRKTCNRIRKRMICLKLERKEGYK